MAFYTQPWFWLVLLGIVLLLVGIICVETTKPNTPWWGWFIFLMAVIMFFAAAILGIRNHYEKEIALHKIAAGDTS